jgi:hypothetical protein
MLANTYNVELRNETPDPGKLPMDDIELTLLTTTRHHHNLMDYQVG